MTDAVVLDASAVLAVVRGEPGAAVVEALHTPPYLCAVNATEVLSVLGRTGIPASRAAHILDALRLRVVPFVPALAAPAAALHVKSRAHGLSLGAVVYTADRAWRALDVDVEIRLIR